MPGMNMLPGGTTLQIPLDAPAGFTAKAGNAQVTLTWTDPKDKYATPEGETAQDPDQLVSVWDHTVLVRKTGSQPAGPNDGTVVVSSSVRDQYASAGYVDTGLQNDTTYYYGVFAYNADGVTSPGAFASATPIAGTPLGNLAEGTLIKILENGSPVEFYLAKHNYEPGLNGQGRELMVRKDCYGNGPFYDGYGFSDYSASTLDNTLNTSYKNRFSAFVQGLMGNTSFLYATGNDKSPPATLSRSIFTPSATEYGIQSYTDLNGFTLVEVGSALPNAASMRACDTAGGMFSQYWARSLYVSRYQASLCVMLGDGSGDAKVAVNNCDRYCGMRPCFTIPSTTLIDPDLNLVEE